MFQQKYKRIKLCYFSQKCKNYSTLEFMTCRMRPLDPSLTITLVVLTFWWPFNGLVSAPLPSSPPSWKGFVLKSKASSSSLVGGCMWLDGVHHLFLLEKTYWYESNSKEEMILWHSMDSTWVRDSLGTYNRIGSRFYVSRTHQDLHQTPNSYGRAIFCQLNRTN